MEHENRQEHEALTPHTDQLKAHLSRISRMPYLNQEEEFQLISKWHEGQDERARQKLLESHQRLILKVAQGYRGYGLPLADLISEGNLGMMQALSKFDLTKGFRFATYASWWIKASIKDYVMRNWSLVRIGTTATQKRLFFKVRSLMEIFARKGYDSSMSYLTREVANHLGVEEDEVAEMVERLKSGDSSLNASLGNEESGEWIDWVASEENHSEQIGHEYELAKQKRLLGLALDSLNKREHMIMTWRRLEEPPRTLDACGEELGLSKERVRQIEALAFTKVQKSMKRYLLEDQEARFKSSSLPS
ncbi:MAG: RNA polymerase factor sigma-32 [Candidatus Puniceispirillum sp.]|nr:RNA polymerase factor sigma-32 [Candidatus Puniceispirillum sp.]